MDTLEIRHPKFELIGLVVDGLKKAKAHQDTTHPPCKRPFPLGVSTHFIVEFSTTLRYTYKCNNLS